MAATGTGPALAVGPTATQLHARAVRAAQLQKLVELSSSDSSLDWGALASQAKR